MPFQSKPQDLALDPGSLILVTGASGFIASHIVREALAIGYHVRGTVRSEDKAARSKSLHASHNYSTIIVKDMSQADAFDEAVKGVDAVIHTTSVMTFSNDPSQVVDPVIKGVTSILKASLAEKRIKRFIYTSSSCATTLAKPGIKFNITTDSWNEEVERDLDGKTGEQEGKSLEVYALSKTKAERAVWDFVKKEKPHWVVNTICPNFNFGAALDGYVSTGKYAVDILNGIRPSIGPQCKCLSFHGNKIDIDVDSINVTDDARLHVIAAIDKTVSNERILAFDEPFNCNKLADIIEKITGRKTIEQDPNELEDLSVVDNARGAELLQKWWGQKGYQGLFESVKQNIEGLY